jgi:hypothetical protein
MVPRARLGTSQCLLVAVDASLLFRPSMERTSLEMKARRIILGDGTKLSSNFSERVWAAQDRARSLEGLPKLRKNFVRFQASDESIHDVPQKFISEVLGIDQRWCYANGRPQNFRILENAKLREHDRQVRQTFRHLLIAARIWYNLGSPSQKHGS